MEAVAPTQAFSRHAATHQLNRTDLRQACARCPRPDQVVLAGDAPATARWPSHPKRRRLRLRRRGGPRRVGGGTRRGARRPAL